MEEKGVSTTEIEETSSKTIVAEEDEFDNESFESEGVETVSSEGKIDEASIEETWGEMSEEGEEEEEKETRPDIKDEEILEEEVYEEEPPDPTAPYDLTDSKEALKAPFKLNEEQMEEIKVIWEAYQNHTPAYADLKGFVTIKELIYMLKCLNLQTYTPEQTQELIEFCVRPPNENNYIYFDHFVHIVTIRQRDMPAEEEIRLALEVLCPEGDGVIDREYFREVLLEHGKPPTYKSVDTLIKEVDLTNDGILNVGDIVSTLLIDLERGDIEALMDKLYPKEETTDNIDHLVKTEVPDTKPGPQD